MVWQGMYKSRFPSTNYLHHILIAYNMAQSNSLRHMLRAGTPHQCIFKRLFHAAMDRITHILNAAAMSNDQRLAKIRFNALSLRVDPHQMQILPAPLNDILHTEVELAGHDDGVGLAGELVEEVERDRVDLVVHVQAVDVGAVVLHDDIDEVVDGGVFVADEHFAVEHLVVAEDVVDEFFVDVFGRRLEGDFHAAGFFLLQVDVGWGAVEADAHGFEFRF